MLLGHSMPAVTDISLAGGTWLTADAGAALVDGKPGRVARLMASDTFGITLTFSGSFVPRIIGVLGLRGVAPGAAVRVTSPAGLGGNASTATAVRFADGSVGAWIVTAGTVVASTLTVTIAATGQVDVGELTAMPAAEVEIERAWEVALVDPTETHRGRASQISGVGRRPYRTLRAQLAPQAAAVARGLAPGVSWQQLQSALAEGRRCVGIPRWRTPEGEIDGPNINSTAIYGLCKLPSIGHLGGDYYGAEVLLEEVPALP